jgi:hypothetical protein
MAKRGRIPTSVKMIRKHQTIEPDHGIMIRVNDITPVIMFDTLKGEDVPGLLFSTYNNTVRLFFPENALVDLVDESTLTQVPFD